MLLAPLLAIPALLPHAARAQPADRYLIDQYFPEGVPGYGDQLGTTVLSRARPEYDPLGIRSGDFIIRPEVDQSIGYNSNFIGQVPPQASLFEQTSASLRFNSDWKRNSIGGELTVTNEQVPSIPNQSTTQWTASLGGSYQIGRDTLTVSASHLNLYESPTALDVTAFNRPGVLYSAPIPFTMNDVRVSYAVDLGRITLIPNFDYTNLTFSNANLYGLNGFAVPAPTNGFILGIPATQGYRDRNLYEGGVTAKYEFAPLRDLLFVVRDTSVDYVNSSQLFGPNRSGNALEVLTGIDYASSAVWRYRVLVGYEVRQFNNYSSHSSPIFEGNVIWQPTGLTTVTLQALRTIEDAADENIAGYVYTSGRLQVDHELRRNILLNAYTSIQRADYIQANGGNETFYGAGTGVTYLMNRYVHLALTYDFVDHNGANGFGPNYIQHIGMLQVRLAM